MLIGNNSSTCVVAGCMSLSQKGNVLVQSKDVTGDAANQFQTTVESLKFLVFFLVGKGKRNFSLDGVTDYVENFFSFSGGCLRSSLLRG